MTNEMISVTVVGFVLAVSTGVLFWGLKKRNITKISLGAALLLFSFFVLLDRFPKYAQTFNAWATLLLAISAFIAVAVSIWLYDRRTRQEHRVRKEDRDLDFKRRRLYEFYGPMLGLINQVIENTEISDKVNKVSEEEWQEICKKHQPPFEDHDKYSEPFQKWLDYEKERFRKEDIGALLKMREIIIVKGHLAYRSTEKLFPSFLEYVAWFLGPLPYEVAKKLEHSGEDFAKFHHDVEEHVGNLKRRLSGEKPRSHERAIGFE